MMKGQPNQDSNPVPPIPVKGATMLPTEQTRLARLFNVVFNSKNPEGPILLLATVCL